MKINMKEITETTGLMVLLIGRPTGDLIKVFGSGITFVGTNLSKVCINTANKVDSRINRIQ